MTVSINTLPKELIWNITRFVDRSTLATLKLVSKLFANSKELHEQLFAKEHPNLRITSLPASSWKELHHSRRLAEQNLLKGFYRIEMLETLPAEASDLHTWISPQGRLFAIYLKLPSKNTLVIRDLQKQQSISKDLEPGSIYSIQDIQDETYVSISNFEQFLLYKIGNPLEQVANFHCESIPSTACWIKGPNSFQLATTFNNELRIRFTQENSSSKTFNQPPRIIGQFFIGDEPFIVVFSDGKLNVYDTATLQNCFSLEVPLEWPYICPLKFVKHYESALYLQFNDGYMFSYQIPTLSKTTQSLKCQHSRGNDKSAFFHIQAKIQRFTFHNSEQFGPFYMRGTTLSAPREASHPITLIHLNDVKPTPGESEGLPIVLLEEGKKIKILRFNFEPSWIDKFRWIARITFVVAKEWFVDLFPLSLIIVLIFLISIALISISLRFIKSPPGQEGVSRRSDESFGEVVRKYIEVSRVLKEPINQVIEQLKNGERVLSAGELAKISEILKIKQSSSG